MSESVRRRRYIAFDWKRGYPAGTTIAFECEICSTEIPSLPADSRTCDCGNIAIDVDYGRVSVRDHSRFRAFYKDD